MCSRTSSSRANARSALSARAIPASGFRAQPVASPITPAPITAILIALTVPDAVAKDADALDLELDLVARPEPALVAVLEDAAGADGARAEDVARPELRVARGVGDDRV